MSEMEPISLGAGSCGSGRFWHGPSDALCVQPVGMRSPLGMLKENLTVPWLCEAGALRLRKVPAAPDGHLNQGKCKTQSHRHTGHLQPGVPTGQSRQTGLLGGASSACGHHGQVSLDVSHGTVLAASSYGSRLVMVVPAFSETTQREIQRRALSQALAAPKYAITCILVRKFQDPHGLSGLWNQG